MSKKTSAKSPDLTLLYSWLSAYKTEKGNSPPYTHLLFKELDSVPDECFDELFEYINYAHEGARRMLRAPLEDSLHFASWYKK